MVDIFAYAQDKLNSQVVAAVIARWAEYREVSDSRALRLIDRLASGEGQGDFNLLIEETYEWVTSLETICADFTEPMCDCGHPIDQHQTGDGPWTGFCYGTLREIGDPIPDGLDPDEPCSCEGPMIDGVRQDASL